MDSNNFSDYLQDRSNSHFHDSANNNQNKSFASTYTTQSLASINTASSSKAVLAALRALQDKIRSLETERTQAVDEISSLKLQMKNQEIENENTRQKEILNNQKLLQESKLSYDRLIYEKNELENKLNKIQEKNSSISDLSNNLQLKIQLLEEDKNGLVKKINDVEFENSQMELHIKQSQLNEKGKKFF
jgi:chromosome segregation ATPase